MKKQLIKAAVCVLGVVAAVTFVIWVLVTQPSFQSSQAAEVTTNPMRLRKHVETLSQDFHPRDWNHKSNLDACATYIADHFRRTGANVEFQPVEVTTNNYWNIIARFGKSDHGRIVVGAHYDAHGEQPGADDNASGVAVLLELAALLGQMNTPPSVDLVAYTLEEPPFFGTGHMGSAVHAKSISSEQTNIIGVIVLEMVGYYSDEWGSQDYPVPMLRFMYPNRGNFLAVVSRWNQGEWIKKVKTALKGTTDLPVYSIRAPASLPGVDLSDHRNYWPHGIEALIVTDTAFYRNKEYHTNNDTVDRLDYTRMAQVTAAVLEAVKSLSKKKQND